MRAREGRIVNANYWLVALALSLTAASFPIFGIGFNAVLSNSMAPEHPAGSVVMTVQVPTEQLAVGDVVRLPLPGSSGESYIHRIVDAIPNGVATTVTTQGDRNVAPDPWSLDIISPAAPVIVATIPLIGHLTGVTSAIGVQLLLMGLVAVFILITLRRAFWRPSKNKEPGRHSQNTS